MAGKEVSRDVQEALALREEVINQAVAPFRGPSDAAARRSIEAMRTSPVYVWEPKGMDSFWRFWASKANIQRFVDVFFERDGLRFDPEICSPGFHFFPVPGRLFGEDTLPDPYRDPIATQVLPPTTRVIGIGDVVLIGDHRLPTIIETVHIDPARLIPSPSQPMPRLTPLKELPPKGTKESALLNLTVETRFPSTAGGIVRDKKPLEWLVYLYKLRVFLEQPYTGIVRHQQPTPKKGQLGAGQPAPEVLEVLMREPLPSRIPKFFLPAISRVTGRKLEYEVDVPSHIRICASGKAVRVRAYTRGPKGVRRERVTKIVR